MTKEVIPISNMGLAVATGSIPGQIPVLKFGENPNISMGGSFADIWDGSGIYVNPIQSRIHDVVSTNIADVGSLVSSGTASKSSANTLVDDEATFISDGVSIGDLVLHDAQMSIAIVVAILSETTLVTSGWFSANIGSLLPFPLEGDPYRIATTASTGAAIYWVWGLDSARLLQEEFIILNGTTPVPTIGSYTRQFRARVFGSGVSGAVGVITSTARTDGTISTQIIDGNNQSLMSLFTIPSDKTGYLLKWWGTISRSIATTSAIRLRLGLKEGISYITQERSMASTGSSHFEYEWGIPVLLPLGTDIFIEANSSANGVSVSAGFDILLIDN